MKAFFSVSNQQEFYRELQQKIGSSYYSDGFESCIKIHPRIGKGQIYNFQFDSGLELQIQEYFTQEPIVLAADIQYCCLGLCWVICGYSNYTLEKQDYNLKPQQSMILYGNEISGIFEMGANQRVAFVGLSLENYLNQPTFIQQKDQLPTCLQNLIDSHDPGLFFQNTITTPEINMVLHQVLNCPYQGLTRKLYLESKSVELLALTLNTLEENALESPHKYQPKKDEIDRLHSAKDILIKNLNNPPSLNALSRQVGLNEYKLKQGFRHVFNNTVFGYLHDYRMTRSRLLLESGTLNVTEVAQAVGYTNLSHFAAAFRKKHGVNPSVFKKTKLV
ncbi:MAG: AraC family transcriptional regulator [Cyanobacteria bacterium J06592_8]